MEGKFVLEQIWRKKDPNAADDSLPLFPVLEPVRGAEIAAAMNPQGDESLDDMDWLLLHHAGEFTLFVRDVPDQDFGEEKIEGGQARTLSQIVLRFQPADAGNSKGIVWDLRRVRDLSHMSGFWQQRWEERKVLAIGRPDAQGNCQLTILCEAPFDPALPPPGSIWVDIKRLLGIT